MKKCSFIIILFLLSVVTAEAAKKALLIGISEYPAGSGWCNIHSGNDIRMLDDTLKRDFKIETVVGKQATHRGILQALESLTRNAHPGDTLWVHFSGHGQQMMSEQSRDEVDSLDECFVPYDARKDKSDDYKGENHFTDNELSSYIGRIRKRVGARGLLIITIDACHSGSMDRGTDEDPDVIYRGTSDIFGMDDPNVRLKKEEGQALLQQSFDMGHIVIISACRAYQKNRETKIDSTYYGSLSYALAESYSEGVRLQTLIEGVFDRMRSLQDQEPFVQSDMEELTTISFVSDNDKVAFPTDDNKAGDDGNAPILTIGVLATIFILFLIWRKRKA